MNFWKTLGKVAQAAVPVVIGIAMPQAAVNTAIGGIVKHTPMINNQAIPAVNLLASTLMYYIPKALDTGDWVAPILPALQEGGILAGMSTALHQTLKIPMAATFNGSLAKRVGPGDKLSI